MARWDEDDYWDDRDELQTRQRRPRSDEEQEEPSHPLPAVPVEQELEGSVYMVPDTLWEIFAPDRDDHPGVCVRCHLPARLAFLNKGTDPAFARPHLYLVVYIDPTPENGLGKRTAFALDPRRVRLHRLLTLHDSPRRLGRLERLGDADLKAIAVWRMEGYSNAEIADRMSCSVVTVGRRLRMIRTILEEG
jgi:ECF sigma factor